jgi:zinc finger SWIM domain-containing protein 3
MAKGAEKCSTVYVIKTCSSFGNLKMDANEGVQSSNFEVGQKFKSFKEFESQLKHYQDAKFIQMYRRSSCKIESTKTKQTITNNDLIFSELKYTCIHGGRNLVSNSKGSRSNQR